MSDTEQSELTPDEVLFELYEWLPLAFQTTVSEVIVGFGPTDDGKNICLQDLKAKPEAEPVTIPPLGFAEEEVLDNINALILTLGVLWETRAEFSPQPGSLLLTAPDGDGAQHFKWRNADEQVFVERRLDRSEQQSFCQTRALYETLEQTVEQERLLVPREIYRETTRYQYDPTTSQITFFNGDTPHSTYEAHLLATHHEGSQNFIWAWANEALPPDDRDRVSILRSTYGTGLRAFTAPEIFCPQVMAERIAGHLAVQLGAKYLFKAKLKSKGHDLSAYLGLRSSPALN